MIYTWNKEVKRQGSSNTSNNRKDLIDRIRSVADEEFKAITSDSKDISQQSARLMGSKVDDLYSSFPSQMVDVFHDIYEEELGKKIRSHIAKKKVRKK
jgi:hypothetical protein